ncbi:MAG: type I-E CRISPR-associated protein Cse1/CasA [Lysobacterales bacterium]
MNLLTDPWIPIRTRNGTVRSIRIAELLPSANDTAAFDDPIEFASPREDFDAALAQFLIGVLDLVFALDGEDQWREWNDQPPTREELDEALSAWAYAFELFGERPFLQDPSVEGEARSPASLLLDLPGDNALENNTDFFVKRREVFPMSPAVAAMALLTLQTNAPSGGKGFRTSVRGGGPLTTLLWPNAESPALFRKLWANVSINAGAESIEPTAVLPWLSDVLVSTDQQDVLTQLRQRLGRVASSDERRLLCYFAAPRRVLLQRAPADGARCALTGAHSDELVIAYRAQNYGPNLLSHLFDHPLSPYYYDKKNEQWLPQHIGERGFTYADWVQLASGSANEREKPAAIVTRGMVHRARQLRAQSLDAEIPVWACAYQMDNMKVLSWHSARLPTFPGLDPDHRSELRAFAQQLIAGAEAAISELSKALRRAWTHGGKGDTSVPSRDLMALTEAEFYERLRWAAAERRSADADLDMRKSWRSCLHWTVMRLFELHAERAVEEVSTLGAIQRAAEAHASLRRFLGAALDKALEIPRPVTSKPKAAGSRGGKKKEAA